MHIYATSVRKNRAVLVLSASDPVKLAEFTTSFSLFATFFYTWFFIAFATFEFSFDSINLQFLFQLPDGIFKISTNFNFYHLGLR